MTHLADANLLVALVWPTHVHHDAARRWLDELAEPWATTPITECAFVRLSSNPSVFDGALRPIEAVELLRELCARGRHEFWPDDVRLVDPTLPLDLLIGHRQVTDLQLLSLCARNAGRLATFDGGVRELLAPAARGLVEVLRP